MKLDKETLRSIRHIILFIALVVLCVINIRDIFGILKFLLGISQPFIWGSAIAFIMNIPLNGIEKHLLKNWKGKHAEKLKRPLGITLSLFFIVFIIVFVIMTVVPQLGKTIVDLGNKVPVFLNNLAAELEKLCASNPQIVEYLKQLQNPSFDWDKILDNAIRFLQNGVGSMLTSTISVAGTIISGAVNVSVSVIFAIYVLSQKERLGSQGRRILKAYLPEKANAQVLRVLGLLNNNFSSFISGQCVEAVILGLMFVVTLTVCGIPYALLIGVLIAFTALIPIVGAFIGCVVGAFFILVDSPLKAVAFVIIFFVLQQIEGNLIYPRVVGNSVGLPSMWVLVAVTLGGSLFGVAGMLLFIPLVSTAYALLRDDVNARNRVKEKARKGKS
ncbi:MAG: AI-2E family transporter [Lachnoclostridium sp.]|nr:AI-2E family transporter [Lachnospira sp.]MCM1249494.1 AI-2E family transporter [Lachnoclostridium sp.]MCM1536563.1 AI-2E family transporter [Clostridium sp.]